jgi:hypothetical protein
LNAQDDYASVVKKLGNPTSDRWVPSAFGSSGYRRLWYSRRGVTLILTGASPDNARYAGMLNRDGQMAQSVETGLDANAFTGLYSAPLIH